MKPSLMFHFILAVCASAALVAGTIGCDPGELGEGEAPHEQAEDAEVEREWQDYVEAEWGEFERQVNRTLTDIANDLDDDRDGRFTDDMRRDVEHEIGNLRQKLDELGRNAELETRDERRAIARQLEELERRVREAGRD